MEENQREDILEATDNHSEVSAINGHLNPSFTLESEKFEEIALNGRGRGTPDLESGGNPFLSPYTPLEESGEETLVYTKIEKVEPRDFSTEVRPQLDVKHYFKDMTVILDLDNGNIDEVIDILLQQMFTNAGKSCVSEAVKSVLFADRQKHIFSEIIQGYDDEPKLLQTSPNPNWFIALCKLPTLKKREVAIVRFLQPVNFGPHLSSVKFFALIIAPNEDKVTKSAGEMARTLGTILSNLDVRHKLSTASRGSFVDALIEKSADLSVVREDDPEKSEALWSYGRHLWENLTRRIRWYKSDYVDGVIGEKTLFKTVSATFFLYFSVLLPCIAFGALASINTKGLIDERRTLWGQVIGGLIWTVFSGQPMLVIATTALVSLYSKVVFDMSNNLDADFYTVYACVGLWNTFFIFIYSFFGISNWVRFSTRSVEEIFTMFITACFLVDAISGIVATFSEEYDRCDYDLNDTLAILDSNVTLSCDATNGKAISILSLVLMIGTLWLSLSIFNFKDSPFLNGRIREMISEYALPLGVILFSFIGKFCFQKVAVKTLNVSDDLHFRAADLSQASGPVIGVSCILGFALSVLLFMDQNITGQIINNPSNRMKKGGAAHLDILVIGVVNCVLSIYGLPWMHAILPHSPLHVYCMADFEERVDDGHVHTVIVRVRETRVTGILCHILMLITLLAVSFIFTYIPNAVLDGLFLYCAFASLRGSSFYERIMLIFTQQSQYPPTHYVRRCPQKEMHLFTVCEVIQLLLLCFVGFYPETYLQMFFPVFIAVLIPIRHFIMPLIISEKYLAALDAFQ